MNTLNHRLISGLISSNSIECRPSRNLGQPSFRSLLNTPVRALNAYLYPKEVRFMSKAKYAVATTNRTIMTLLLGISLYVPSVSAAASNFDVTKFDVPFPGTDQSFPLGINDRGQIVGSYHNIQSSWHGFIYDRGQFSSFDFPVRNTDFTDAETHFTGINNSGQIVGYIDAFLPPHNCCEQHGFVFERGVFTQIDVPFPGVLGTLATGINDQGQIVGVYSDNKGLHGFILDRGEFSSLDVPFPGARDTGFNGMGINNRGEIVGTYNSVTPGLYIQGFVFERGVFSHLDTPPGSITNGTFVNGINDRGQIVGCVDGHAFVFEQDVFNPVDIPFEGACPYGINNRGQIVGLFNGFQGFVGTPVINNLVNLAVQSSSLNPNPVPGGPTGVFTITALLTNTSPENILEPINAIVRTLSNGNKLLSATEGDGGEGSKQAIDAGSDDSLIPNKSVTVQFRIGLADRNPFSFFVDVSGIVNAGD
jgi:uncharacterized membrane protein